ncbi:response regulator receiver modulated CheB methylesterase, partial [Candidatus Magnetoovum chiemensis]
MKNSRLIKVLVVDDSPIIRKILCDILKTDPEISIIGEAADGVEAVSKALSFKPDIITMDIEMPFLSGLEAISRIMAEKPVPILVITSVSGVKTAFDAVSRGALDVMQKSDVTPKEGGRLIRKIKMLAGIDVKAHHAASGRKNNIPNESMIKEQKSSPVSIENISMKKKAAKEMHTKRIIAIASSTGGTHALSVILSKLPAQFPVPIVVAQHVAAGFTQSMADWLNTCTQLTVTSAQRGDSLTSGKVYINPSESNMRINNQGVIVLSDSVPNQLYHPSCDELLSSVAQSFGYYSVGIILSGMGHDGVTGIKAIHSSGGTTIAQDEQTSVVFGMNGIAEWFNELIGRLHQSMVML